MRKSDMVRRIIAMNPNLPETASRKSVDKVFDSIIEQLGRGGDIELRGFGRFFLSRHAQRTVRNPRTGETFVRKEFPAIRFRPGRSISALINPERA
jgi:integration host factor subunit beta